MRTKSHPANGKASVPAGFALVTCLSLLVLLTILAMGLMSLSTLSLRISGRGEAMADARATARLALILAIGELQKSVGPDQRATGVANLAGKADGSPLEPATPPGNDTTPTNTSKGLSAVQPGTRYWTGVWTQIADPEQIFTRTPSAKLVKWLVSGNEDLPPDQAFTPASSIAAVDGSGQVSDPTKAVVLVGLRTVGGASTNADLHVAVPLVAVSPEGPAKHPSGRQGWWIGDEGVKAKLNLPATRRDGSPTYADLASPRRAWETVDGFDAYPPPGSADEQDVGKVVTVGGASLLDPSLAAGVNSPLGRNFHAATTDSFGVLTDVLESGLKIDLTRYLTDGFPSDPPAGPVNPPRLGTNIIPTSVASRIRGPKWDALKQFHDLGQSVRGGQALEVTPAARETDAAIAPVVTDLRLLFGAKLVPAGTDTYRVHPCAKIAVAIANPYAVTLRWGAPVELEFKNATDPARRPSRIFPVNGQPAYIPQNASEPAVLNNAIFRIPPGELPPGEARAYTIGAPAVRPPNTTSRVIVTLVPFSGTGLSNLDNSVQLEHAATNSVAGGSQIALDVREDATTSQLNLELRLAGSSHLLKRIERFELDNAPFDVTQRRFTRDGSGSTGKASAFTRAFPLQYYGFQLSQPGGEYEKILASGQLGLRSSTIRTFTDFNLQGTRVRKPIISYNPPPYFMQIADSYSALPFVAPGGDTGGEFTKNLISFPLPWGRSPFGPEKTILFSPPNQLASLAQFQHADLTADDFSVSIGHQPGNAVGNSYASPFVFRHMTVQRRSDFTITNFATATSAAANYYDLSYLLNASLWDGCFLSTIPGGGDRTPLNPRLVKIDPGNDPLLADAATAAAGLLVDGAHNVNSTEKNAWKALLAGSRHLSHPADEESTSGGAMFPRSLEQASGSTAPPSGSEEDSFSGYRRLTDDQLDALAEEITRQVRLRGPFVCMSHFVNRALYNIRQNAELGRSGALQSAIDNCGINISPDGLKNAFSDVDLAYERVNLQADGGAPRADLVGGDATQIPNSGADGTWPPTSHDLNPGAVAGILADRQMLTDSRYRREQGYRSTGIPGWLTQADVLQVIGPSLTVRSDTFRIRAYGETLDPTTGETVARAWCEAIVQRLPNYVDPSDAPELRKDDLKPVNFRFGRRFQTVSFRWLSPDEI